MAKIIDGKKISQEIKDELKERVAALKERVLRLLLRLFRLVITRLQLFMLAIRKRLVLMLA